MRARHDAQCPPLQLCGRFKPARNAAASTVSCGSAAKLCPVGTMVTCGMTLVGWRRTRRGAANSLQYPAAMNLPFLSCLIVGCGYVGTRLARLEAPRRPVLALVRSGPRETEL